MRKKMVITLVLGLLFTMVVPAAQVGATGNYGYEQPKVECPDGYSLEGDWCIKRTHETVPAEKVVTYSCPYGYDGPTADNKCTKEGREYFPATPIYDLVCPEDFTLATGDVCEKVEVTIDTVHVDETSEFVCTEGATLVGDECMRTRYILETIDPNVAEESVCPDGFAGPDAAGNCADLVINTADSSTVVLSVCPQGFDGPDINDECSLTTETVEFKGIVLTTTPTCAENYTLDGADCVRFFDTITILVCPDDLVLQDIALTGFGCYPDPPVSVLPVDPIPTPACADEFTGPLDMNGGLVCEERIAPIDVTTNACPAEYTGPDGMNLCSRPIDQVTVVQAIVSEAQVCPDGFVGPDAAGTCVQAEQVTATAVIETSPVCPDTYFGPTADGDCARLGTETVTVPAIEVPLFVCPAGYDGPDAKWDCSKETTETITVDPDQVIVGYDCPDDAEGPNDNNKCKRVTVEMVDASKHVDYKCPRGASGPDHNHECKITIIDEVKPTVVQTNDCTIKLYDFPDGHGFLAKVTKEGQWNFKDNLHWLNNDVESVRVSAGCSVSVSRSYDGTGWCVTLGGGLHNLPDDEMSWISVPGTGCNTPWH